MNNTTLFAPRSREVALAHFTAEASRICSLNMHFTASQAADPRHETGEFMNLYYRLFQLENRPLTDLDRIVAKAISNTAVITAAQLRLYLCLTQGLSLSERDLEDSLQRLLYFSIIGSISYVSDADQAIITGFHVGIAFNMMLGEHPLSFAYLRDPQTPVEEYVAYLQHTQLMLSMCLEMHPSSMIVGHTLRFGDDKKLFVRYALRQEEAGALTYVLHFRRDQYGSLLSELNTHAEALAFQHDHLKPTVVVCVESAADSAAFTDKIRLLRLPFTVKLTSAEEGLSGYYTIPGRHTLPFRLFGT